MLAGEAMRVTSVPLLAVRTWRGLSLASRFALAIIVLSLVGTISLSTWVSEKVEQTAIARAAGSAAVYVRHFVAPMFQNLAQTNTLSQQHVDQLDRIVNSAAVRLRVLTIKIWNAEGKIIYSSNHASIGKKFPIDEALSGALQGAVTAEFEEPGEESRTEFAEHENLIEIYAPVHDSNGRIVAVAEFYERADDLAAHLRAAKTQSWLVASLVIVSIFGACFILVREGSRTIDRQKQELTLRIADLSDAIESNKDLHVKIERGAREVIEENERFRRRIASDLHDGPAQLIGSALLKLDPLIFSGKSQEGSLVIGALSDALREIRGISSGFLFPDFNDQTLEDCLHAVVRTHEANTGSKVETTFVNLPADCPTYLKVCLFRFVQEGLANAYRHAGGRGQRVAAKGFDDAIEVNVMDSGPGFSIKQAEKEEQHLGLVGLRNRVESLRGKFTVTSGGEGTTLSAWLPLGGEIL